MCEAEDLANSLTHEELVEVSKSTLANILENDPLLSDLPPDVMLEELKSLIAVEHGKSITVIISRENEPQLKVIVPPDITVRGLKKAVARHFEIHQQRTQDKVKISWKYIWKTYDLCYDSVLLQDDVSSIDCYGVKNKVVLSFKKKKKKR